MKKKKSSGSAYALLVILALLAVISAAAGIFYAFGRGEKDILEDAKGNEVKEVSLLDESVEAQRVLDNILLTKDNWQLIERDHEEKDVSISGSQNKVKISERQLAVGIPESTSLTGAGQWLMNKAEKAGLAVIGHEKSTYKEWDAYKIQLGISVKAGDSKRKFVTDTVYFFYNSNLKEPDKDIEEKDVSKPMPKYTGKLAVIVDDCGYDIGSVRTLLDTGFAFNYAILPYKNYSSDVLEMVKTRGHVAMLHLPMEPLNSSAMSEGSSTVCVNMPESKIKDIVQKAVYSLPGIVGVNNHQGSRATSDQKTMDITLKVLKKEGLFFVDSRTTAKSVAKDRAMALGVETARNDIFLDNSTNPQEIRAQIYKAMEMAQKNGSAIAICHARPNTAKAWKMYADEIRKTGIKIVPVTELLY